MDVLGVHRVGVTAENGRCLVLSMLFIAVAPPVRAEPRRISRGPIKGKSRRRFGTRHRVVEMPPWPATPRGDPR